MASFLAPALSTTSGKVKAARKLARRSFRAEQRLFLAEGWKSLEAALNVPGCVVEVFVTQAALEQHEGLLHGLTVHLVDERAMGSLADSVTPQGIVALCRFVDRPLASLLDRSTGCVVVCADVRDPGNAGTIIRTADAFGVAGVVLAGNSVDPYNPKTVRATVGSLWHVPIVVEPDPVRALSELRAAGYRILATDGNGEVEIQEAGLTDSHAWLFGNEAWGLPAELAALADARVRIPMAGRAESLNLSTAAAVALWESTRH